MNTYIKYCPNVFVAACDEQHTRGEIIEMTTSRGKTHECEVWNYLGQKNGKYIYSITRADGTNHQTRAAARAQKYEEWADKAQQRSDDAFQRSENAVAGIPFGQPILVGHHSESRHRNALKRSDQAMRKSVEEQDKAKSHEHKAEYWERLAEKIDLSMPESIDYFAAKLARAEEYHQGVKSGKYPREHAYTLTYAKKAVNELRQQLETAQKLWGDPSPDGQKTDPAPAPMPEPTPEPTPAPDGQKDDNDSPCFKHYKEMKAKYPDRVVLFRVGDYYETFKDDAELLHDVCGHTISNGCVGVPLYNLDKTLQRLISAGFSAIVCDELEAPQPKTKTPTEQKNNSTMTKTKQQLAAQQLDQLLTDEKIREYINASHFDCVHKWIECRPDGTVCVTNTITDSGYPVLLEICSSDSYACDCELCAPFKAVAHHGTMTRQDIADFKREYGLEPSDIEGRTVLDLYNPQSLAELIQDYRDRARLAFSEVPKAFFAE